MILTMDTVQSENDLVKAHSGNDVITISDPEEGEINDDSNLEDITDVSSDEEKYLKQRIKILENINSALERKEARRLSLLITGSKLAKPTINLESLSEISNAEDVIFIKDCERSNSELKPIKSNKKKRKLRPRSAVIKPRVKKARKKVELVTKESSSSDSDDEKAHQRRRLRNAVRISPIDKSQKSSLKSRLLNMIKAPELVPNTVEVENIPMDTVDDLTGESKLHDEGKITPAVKCSQYETLCMSDDDPEVLRQLALKSKSSRNLKNIEPIHDQNSTMKVEQNRNINKAMQITDEVDSDTIELRAIALKSVMLKKAMERKKLKKGERKKQLKLRRSITSTFSDDALEKAIDFSPLRDILNEPETDIEAVDMEINDEIDDSPIYENNISSAHNVMFSETKDNLLFQQHPMAGIYDDYQFGEYSPQPSDQYLYSNYYSSPFNESIQHDNNPLDKLQKPPIGQIEEDNDEDEAILRAQLLSSMSKSGKTLPTEPIIDNQENIDRLEIKETLSKPADNNFVIKLGDSDFDSECEVTRNLITMHNKLKNQGEFERNLEAFLKSARTKAENQLSIDQDPPTVTSQVKHTPMVVKHLPESHQEEYRQLIKRMAELDKVRQARQLVLENSIKMSQLKKKLYPNKGIPESIDGKNILTEMSNILHSGTQNAQSIVELQITTSRQKLSNQTKMLESLTKESKALQQKNELLTIQFRAVAAALQSSRAALSQNQEKIHAANRNLTRLRKQHQILLTRSKSHSVKRSYFSNIKLTKNVATIQNDPFYENIDTIKQKNIPTILSKESSSFERTVSPSVFENDKSLLYARLTGNEKIINTPRENQGTNLSQDLVNNCRTFTQEVFQSRENQNSCLQNMPEVQNTSNEGLQPPVHNLQLQDSGISTETPELFKQEVSLSISEKPVKTVEPDIKIVKKKCSLEIIRENEKNNVGIYNDKPVSISLSTNEKDIENNCIKADQKQHRIMENLETEEDSSIIQSAFHAITPIISEDSELTISTENTPLMKDYKSPLQFLQQSLTDDIQAIFCPFEVGGSCKDPECKYYHPKN